MILSILDNMLIHGHPNHLVGNPQARNARVDLLADLSDLGTVVLGELLDSDLGLAVFLG
jgi:hypothetical protein